MEGVSEELLVEVFACLPASRRSVAGRWEISHLYLAVNAPSSMCGDGP